MHRVSCLLKETLKRLPTTTQHYNNKSMSSWANKVAEVYKEVVKVGEVKDACIINVQRGNGHVMVQVTRSFRDVTRKETFQSVTQHLVRNTRRPHDEEDDTITFSPVYLDSNVLLQRVSNSGRLKAEVVKKNDNNNNNNNSKTPEEYVVIVTDCRTSTVSIVNLSSADKHGKVYSDSTFSCLEFSPDETKLLYVAEMRQPKPTSFFDSTPKSGDEDSRGQEYVYREDWGEQLVAQSQGVICILDLTTNDVNTYPLPDGLCPAHLCFVPSGAGGAGAGRDWGVLGVGFGSRPYRLGLIYCQNRHSRMFQLRSDGTVELLGSVGWHIGIPRFSPDGTLVAYMRTKAGGPHAKCGQLCVMDWKTKMERVVIDTVDRERKLTTSGPPTDTTPTHVFRGVYSATPGLTRRCWNAAGTKVIFSTPNLDVIATYSVCVDSGELTLAGDGRGDTSERVWDVTDDTILLERTSMCTPGHLVLLRLGTPPTPLAAAMKVTATHEMPQIPKSFLTRWTLINPEPHPKPQYSDLPYSVLYLGPTKLPEGGERRPLIVWPHGGPHVCLADEFRASSAFFVRLGFSVLWPNYRGSTGAGQDSIDSLPGHAGLADVSDVHFATLDCLRRYSDVLDQSRVYLLGGSHGGFLVTHLAAQHPSVYRAVSARNPVVDIAAMASVSDIPDWCFVESGVEFEPGKVPDASTLTKMTTCSPTSHLDTLTAPTLLQVGLDDRRVPPSQALYLYRMLKARGVKTELYVYRDCHPLGKVEVEADCLVHIALWSPVVILADHQESSSDSCSPPEGR
ncbi:hypothetical protein Pcinc_010916 [Petrolisthes cinctipes]|uniref:Prolyl endopeptidase n=1 Tax=Petrolisthes cinctipes TaxID=88211 RepID=A0AAE1KWW7_PETCI|nr:hypothetical protein Pcinc_010916 [Petrolisthes cinctipes]